MIFYGDAPYLPNLDNSPILAIIVLLLHELIHSRLAEAMSKHRFFMYSLLTLPIGT